MRIWAQSVLNFINIIEKRKFYKRSDCKFYTWQCRIQSALLSICFAYTTYYNSTKFEGCATNCFLLQFLDSHISIYLRWVFWAYMTKRELFMFLLLLQQVSSFFLQKLCLNPLFVIFLQTCLWMRIVPFLSFNSGSS